MAFIDLVHREAIGRARLEGLACRRHDIHAGIVVGEPIQPPDADRQLTELRSFQDLSREAAFEVLGRALVLPEPAGRPEPGDTGGVGGQAAVRRPQEPPVFVNQARACPARSTVAARAAASARSVVAVITATDLP